MKAETVTDTVPPPADRRSLEAALIGHLESAGYARCEPAVLQPASAFFDSGEDMRSRLYLTSDVSGAEYCLRPEYTVPVCRAYLASPHASRPAAYSYCGPVFRYRPDAAETVQAGLESFGRPDREAADAEILVLTLEAVEAQTAKRLAVRIGDAGLFSAFLAALDLSPQWQRRILRGHVQGKPLDAILTPPAGPLDHSGVLAALEGGDRKGARELVEDLLSIAGIATVGGRSAAEIADRFLEQAALQNNGGFPAEKRALIETFLTIEGDPDEAASHLRDFAEAVHLDLAAPLETFETRLGFIAARGLDVGRLLFSSRFVRNLDYYTGFVFEGHGEDRSRPVIGGGRYDNLLKSLGAAEAIPAVGASIFVDRLQNGDAA